MKRILLFGIVIFLAAQAKAQSEELFLNKDSEKKIQIDIYPNPTTDYLNIQLAGTELNSEVSFHLHNIIGNEVKVEFEKMGDNKYRINVETLSPGYYLLAIKETNTKFSKTLKFLKR